MYKIVLILFAITLICVSDSLCQSIEAHDSNDFDPLNQWSQEEKEHFKKALSFQEMPNYNRDSANFYYEKTLTLLENKKGDNIQQLAQVYRKWCDYDTRHFSFPVLDSIAKIGWKYAKTLSDDSENRVFNYSHLANWAKIKLDIGDLDSSIVLFTAALSKVENNNSEALKANIAMNKGWFHARYNLGTDNELTFQNLYQSLRFYEKQSIEQFDLQLFTIYKSLIAQHSKSNSDSVFYYLEKAKSILVYNKNPLFHAWYYCVYGRQLNTIPARGENYVSDSRVAEAEDNILQALKILQTYRINNNSIEPYCNGLLADIYQSRGAYNQAIIYYKRSFNFYMAINSRYSAGDMIQYISLSFEKQGLYDSALYYYKKYYKESVKFEQEKNQRSLRESELQIDVLKRDKELKLKEDQAFLYAIALGVIGMILGFLYFFYKKRQVRNRELQRLNNELESKNKQNELLLKEIHHRVKNNLEMVKSLIALQSAELEDSETKDAMIASQNRVQSMGIIHQKLYQGENLGSVEMKDYFVNLSEGILDSFDAEEKVKIECAMDNLELDIDTAVPIGLIVNELLTNALKYAFPDNTEGKINISLSKESPDTLTLKVSDNGIGKLDGKAIQGTGFGSQLIKLLTQQLNGKMNEETQDGVAVSFEFTLNNAA